ncbi:MAG: chloride channel protein [Gammaproteobacteria bacterium]
MTKKTTGNGGFRESLRLRLATTDRLPQLALLGIVSGILTGLVIITFRIIIEFTQAHLLPGNQSENYEALTPWVRLFLAIGGGLTVGLLFQFVAKGANQVGVVHVMERLAYHQGRLPIRNAIWQFIGASISLICGHSVGREGPGIHLGATTGSQLGQVLQLPNNSTRILVSCGVAAAIAASFNTPLAGVIFSMEVVMMEYTLAGFTPVILAAVSATSLCRWFFGSDPAFAVPALHLQSLQELPFIILTGIVLGILAAIFINTLNRFTHVVEKRPYWQRTTLAGIIIGICALFVPEIMGVGYDTVNNALIGSLGIGILVAIVLFKLVATSAAIGLGLPGGLIGPTLVIGAAAGGAMGIVADLMFPGSVSSHAFYAMLGMGAMMAATLQAPLAALMAMLELTGNPNIILPGMLAVISSGLTCSELFGKSSIFVMLIRARGLDYRNDPVAQTLRRQGVATAMNKQFVISDAPIAVSEIKNLLENKPQWIVIINDKQPRSLLPATDLAQYLQQTNDNDPETQDTIDLMDIPAKRRELESIHLRANLQEALDTINETHAEALCVIHGHNKNIKIYGILTQQDIEKHYQY